MAAHQKKLQPTAVSRMACISTAPPTADVAAHLVITCSTCKAELPKHGLPFNAPNEMVRNAAKRADWYITRYGEHAYCPACDAARTKKGRPPIMKPVDKPKVTVIKPILMDTTTLAANNLPIPEPKPAPAPAKVVSGPSAVKRQRKLFEMLNDYFLVDAGSYVPGWNDKRIAAELDCSPDYVAATRKDGWGELRTLPEIEPLLHELKELTDKIDAEFRQLHSMVDEVTADLTKRARDMRDTVVNLRQRLIS